MTLQLLHYEFPYIWGKFDFLFYQCNLLHPRLFQLTNFCTAGDQKTRGSLVLSGSFNIYHSTFLIYIWVTLCSVHSVIKECEIRDNTASKVCYSFVCSAGNNVPLFLTTWNQLSDCSLLQSILHSFSTHYFFIFTLIDQTYNIYIYYSSSTLLLSSGLPLGRGLHWGAEPGFELGPALQQAAAQLPELRRTLWATAHSSEPRRTLYSTLRSPKITCKELSSWGNIFPCIFKPSQRFPQNIYASVPSCGVQGKFTQIYLVLSSANFRLFLVHRYVW
jgi:hypothetical protein